MLVVVVTLVLHSLSDMATVYIAASVMGMSGLLNNNTMGMVQTWLGLGTAVHHLVDFFLAYLIMIPLAKANIMNPTLLKKGVKDCETVSSHQ